MNTELAASFEYLEKEKGLKKETPNSDILRKIMDAFLKLDRCVGFRRAIRNHPPPAVVIKPIRAVIGQLITDCAAVVRSGFF